VAREKKQQEETDTAGWMNTYADLVTLLLCFFVLLFAMSKADEGRIKAFMAGFEGGAGILDGGKMLEFEKNIGQMLESAVDGLSDEELGVLQNILQEMVESEQLTGQISVTRNERGIIISLMDKILFDPGLAEIKLEANTIIEQVGIILNMDEFKDRSVAVEGHSDNDPVRYVNMYPTNWELSTARATNVLRFLVEKSDVNPVRISAAGYSFYHPIAPNDTPENKAKNRRADIVILGDSYENTGP